MPLDRKPTFKAREQPKQPLVNNAKPGKTTAKRTKGKPATGETLKLIVGFVP